MHECEGTGLGEWGGGEGVRQDGILRGRGAGSGRSHGLSALCFRGNPANACAPQGWVGGWAGASAYVSEHTCAHPAGACAPWGWRWIRVCARARASMPCPQRRCDGLLCLVSQVEYAYSDNSLDPGECLPDRLQPPDDTPRHSPVDSRGLASHTWAQSTVPEWSSCPETVREELQDRGRKPKGVVPAALKQGNDENTGS